MIGSRRFGVGERRSSGEILGVMGVGVVGVVGAGGAFLFLCFVSVSSISSATLFGFFCLSAIDAAFDVDALDELVVKI